MYKIFKEPKIMDIQTLSDAKVLWERIKTSKRRVEIIRELQKQPSLFCQVKAWVDGRTPRQHEVVIGGFESESVKYMLQKQLEIEEGIIEYSEKALKEL